MILNNKTQSTKERAEEIAKEIHLSFLREGKSVCLTASGPSMYPYIKDKDMIRVIPLKEEEARIGDILIVDNHNKGHAWFYAHRLVDIIEDKHKILYITKGDAQSSGDKPISFSCVAGKVREIKRRNHIINLETRLWQYLNPHIARISLRRPARLRRISPFASLLTELPLLPSKLTKFTNI